MTIITSQATVDAATDEVRLAFSIDLRKDRVRIESSPGQHAELAEFTFNVARGLAENATEASVLKLVQPAPLQLSQTLDTVSVFEAARQQSIPLVAIGTNTLSQLDGLSISPEARSRITASVQAGDAVLVPSQMVAVNGSDVIAWLQIAVDGSVVGVTENGGHGALSEFASLQKLNEKLQEEARKFISAEFGQFSGSVFGTAYILCSVAGDADECALELKENKQAIVNLVQDVNKNIDRLSKLKPFKGLLKIDEDSFKNQMKGVVERLSGLALGDATDPPVPQVLLNPHAATGLPTNRDQQALDVPGDGSGLTTFSVSTDETTLATDQNNAVSTTVQVTSGVTETVSVKVEAPEGWSVRLQEDGLLQIQPAAGTTAGTHCVRVMVRSGADPTRVASTLVNVDVSATAAGVELEVQHDSFLYVPYFGAQIPTAYTATIKNVGPTTDTFDLTFDSLPAGLKVVGSLSSVVVPAGATATVGVYVVPDGSLPAEGTPVDFSIGVESASDSHVAATATVSFVVPAIHGVAIIATPATVGTTPGAPVAVEVQFAAVGNVDEQVQVTGTASSGLTLSGVSNITVAAGDAQTLVLTVIPDAGVPLNSRLAVNLQTSFGAPESQTLEIPVVIAVPGADAIVDAADAAELLGNIDLRDRLNDLVVSLTNLVQQPDRTDYRVQTDASLSSIMSLLAADRIFAPYVDEFSNGRLAILAATDAAALQAATVSLGSAITDLGTTVRVLADSDFELFLSPASQAAIPLVPREFALTVHNIGRETTTYDISVDGLPANVLIDLPTTSITLDRDEIQVIPFALTQTTTDELAAFSFSARVDVSGVSAVVSKSIDGSLRTRREFVSVTSVDVSSTIMSPGDAVAVGASLLNAVNRSQDALVRFEVKNSDEQSVFTSSNVPTSLSVQTSLETVDLGVFDTTGLSAGNYTLRVVVSDLLGAPVDGAEASVSLFIGTPLVASLEVAPSELAPGTSTVGSTLHIASLVALGDPVELVGFLPIDDFGNDAITGVTTNGDHVYVFGNAGVHSVNVTDPTLPSHVGTTGTFRQSGGVVDGNRLYTYDSGLPTNIAVFANSGVSTFDLGGTFGTAAAPGRFQRVFPNYQFISDMAVANGHLFASTVFVGENLSTGDITFQNGTVLSFPVDGIGNIGTPSILLNTYGGNATAPIFRNGGDFNMFRLLIPEPTTLLVASTTSTGGDAQSGVGRVLVVDISDPDNINSDPPNESKIVGTLDIPGTVQAHGLARDGNLAVVVASQGGWLDPFDPMNVENIGPTGNLVLATIDIADPRNPILLHTQVLNRAARGGGDNLLSLGDGRFAFSSLGEDSDSPQLFVVDASDPNNVTVELQLDVPSHIVGLTTDGTYLYATSAEGLSIYTLGGAGSIPIQAAVEVPRAAGVSVDVGSFSLTPDQVIAGATADTYVWNIDLNGAVVSQTVQWNSQVVELQPGETRDVIASTVIDYSLQGNNLQLALPPAAVFAGHVLGMTPATQDAAPGGTVDYFITLDNPTAGAIDYDITLLGLPAAWTSIATPVTVAAGGSLQVPLHVSPDPFALATEYAFVVTAAAGSVHDAVEAVLNVTGAPILPVAEPESQAVVVQLIPSTIQLGQGTSNHLVLRLINAGSQAEAFNISVDLPPGIEAELPTEAIVVAPGSGNYRDVTIPISAQVGTLIGSDAINVFVTSPSGTSAHVSGLVEINASGVAVEFSADIVNVGGSILFNVTNTGQVFDTFDIAISGPTGLAATVNRPSVTLNPGESTEVSVTVSNFDLAFPGQWQLIATATSQSAASVRGTDTANLVVPIRLGVSATFAPETTTLVDPGAAMVLLTMENLGNVSDQYEVKIVGISGDVVAHLVGPDGVRATSLSPLSLPGLSLGNVILDAQLLSPGDATVTVEVSSLTAASVVASATATIRTAVTDGICLPQIDFETDAHGNLLYRHSVIADQWLAWGMQVSSGSPGVPTLVAASYYEDDDYHHDDRFDRHDRDHDGRDDSGHDRWFQNNDGHSGMDLGNVLVVGGGIHSTSSYVHDNDDDHDDDHDDDDHHHGELGAGGILVMTFEVPVALQEIRLVDVDVDRTATTIRAYDQQGNLVATAAATEHHRGLQAVPLDILGVARLEVEFEDHGAIADIVFCEDGVGDVYAIGDAVFDDANGNGIQEDGEQPLANVQVELYRTTGESIGTVTTDYQGSYRFTAIDGDYEVRLSPGNFESGAVLSGGIVTGGTERPVTLRGVDELNIDFGVDMPDRPDPGMQLRNGVLTIVGTDGRDLVRVSEQGAWWNRKLRVAIKLSGQGWDTQFFDVGDVERIEGKLYGGNDHVKVWEDVAIPTWFDGGEGNDFLQGGGGDDVLIGGDGNDVAKGGGGNDILLGDAGSDELFGESGDDLVWGGIGRDFVYGGQGGDIVSGGTVIADGTMLFEARQLWTECESYETRANNVSQLLIANTIVLDDDTKDTVKGNGGRDLLFARIGSGRRDDVDQRWDETLLELFPF
ncbi:MAG: hypothetical protein KDA99_11870 [Planctomycetales bacterium]|nr:hypothetical protein [Planctomycetales bacterium]